MPALCHLRFQHLLHEEGKLKPTASAAPPTLPAPQSLGAWAIAIRPRSFPIAVGPVAVGVAFSGLHVAHLDWWVAGLSLLAAVLMQAITNLQNDVGFTARGGEMGGRRVGLPRATTLALLTPSQVRIAVVALSCLAIGVGLVLTYLRGWPVLAMGVASLAAALAYMGGPKPIAYTPWGEFTVFVFFGLIAVEGSYWLLAGTPTPDVFLAASFSGALATAALVVNNQRDREHDATIGRRTFAVVWGPRAAVRLYTVCVAAPLLIALAVAIGLRAPTLALPLLMTPWAWRLGRDLRNCPGGLAYNAILLRTFRNVHWCSALLAAGAVMAWP